MNNIKDNVKKLLNTKVKNIPEPDENFLPKLYDTIPTDFQSKLNPIHPSIKFGIVTFLIALITFSVITILNKQGLRQQKDKFKPTKTIVLDYPSFEPTKVVEITPADKIE